MTLRSSFRRLVCHGHRRIFRSHDNALPVRQPLSSETALVEWVAHTQEQASRTSPQTLPSSPQPASSAYAPTYQPLLLPAPPAPALAVPKAINEDDNEDDNEDNIDDDDDDDSNKVSDNEEIVIAEAVLARVVPRSAIRIKVVVIGATTTVIMSAVVPHSTSLVTKSIARSHIASEDGPVELPALLALPASPAPPAPPVHPMALPVPLPKRDPGHCLRGTRPADLLLPALVRASVSSSAGGGTPASVVAAAPSAPQPCTNGQAPPRLSPPLPIRTIRPLAPCRGEPQSLWSTAPSRGGASPSSSSSSAVPSSLWSSPRSPPRPTPRQRQLLLSPPLDNTTFEGILTSLCAVARVTAARRHEAEYARATTVVELPATPARTAPQSVSLPAPVPAPISTPVRYRGIPIHSHRGHILLQGLRRLLLIPLDQTPAETLLFILDHPHMRCLCLPVTSGAPIADPSVWVQRCNALSWDGLLERGCGTITEESTATDRSGFGALTPASRARIVDWLARGEPLFLQHTPLGAVLLRRRASSPAPLTSATSSTSPLPSRRRRARLCKWTGHGPSSLSQIMLASDL